MSESNSESHKVDSNSSSTSESTSTTASESLSTTPSVSGSESTSHKVGSGSASQSASGSLSISSSDSLSQTLSESLSGSDDLKRDSNSLSNSQTAISLTATSSTVASHEGSQAALPQTGAESTASTGWLGGFGLFLAGLFGRRKKRDDKKNK